MIVMLKNKLRVVLKIKQKNNKIAKITTLLNKTKTNNMINNNNNNNLNNISS